MKIIQISQNEGQLFSNITNSCRILSLTCLRGSTECGSKKIKKRIFTHLKLCLADAIYNFKWVKII